MAALAGFKTGPCDERFLKAYQANSPVAPLVCAWSALGLRLVCATTLCVHCHWFVLGLWLVCATILCVHCHSSALGLRLVCATILLYTAIGLRLICAWSAVGLRHYPLCTLPFVCAWSVVGLRRYPLVALVCATILSAPCATILCARRHLVSARFVPAYLVVLFLMINVKFMLAAPLVLWLLWLASKLAPVTKGF